MGTGLCEIYPYSSRPHHPDRIVDLQECKSRKIHQHGCLEQETAAFTLHFYHHRNRDLFRRRFLSAQGNGLDNFYAVHPAGADAGE